MTSAEKELWIDDAREALADNERVIKQQAERVAMLEMNLDRLRQLLYVGLGNTAGAAPTRAEDAHVSFAPAEKARAKRTKKAAA